VQWAGLVVVAAAQLVFVVQQRESRVGEKFPKAPAGGERAGLKAALAPAALSAGAGHSAGQAAELQSCRAEPSARRTCLEQQSPTRGLTFIMVLALALKAELNGYVDLTLPVDAMPCPTNPSQCDRPPPTRH
jgi:hypothetical protein